jgi:hypothetical protein
MNYDEARHLLLKHAGASYVKGDATSSFPDGFLNMLRPYRGLREANFHAVFEALLVVGQQLHAAESVDRKLAYSLWSMCATARLWGIEPSGMLQRNKLITAADSALLRQWIDILEGSSLSLLTGCPPYYQVRHYAEYILQHRPGENVDFFIPLMCQYLDDPDSTDPDPIPEALGTLGRRAVSALPSLRAASQRMYAEYCHAEAQEAIAQAIRRIEA